MSKRRGAAATAVMLLVVIGSFFSTLQVVSAQITTATISGSIRDESGGVLPGVSVVVTNQGTGITRNLVSDEEGRYQASNLAVGTYEIRAALAGFQQAVHRNIALTVGRHAVVDVLMAVGELSENVVVTGEGPMVDTQSSTVSGVVEELQIRELPLNLRSYEQLATLQPGVVAGSLERVGVRGGAGTQLYISGARSEYNEFQIDNVASGDTWGKTPGGMSGGVLGVESVKEFSVLTSTYSAEYGKAAGGVVNVITRSGTNAWDGNVYLFHRNEALDSKNYFDREKPEFTRNQFGAALGGPIIKDRTFFFVNYEGLRQELPRTVTSTVPNAAARQGILPNRTVEVKPEVIPYLNLWPMPNGPDHGDGTADHLAVRRQETIADYALGKLDYQISANHSLTVRHIYEDGHRASQQLLDAQTGRLEGKKQNTSIQYQTILSPRLINEFRFGFNRAIQNDYDLFEGLSPDLNFIQLPGRVLGSLSVTGLSGYGHAGSQPLFFNFDNYQFINHLTFTPGRHSMRIGADIRRTHLDAQNVAALHGVYSFNSLEQFLRGEARFFRMLLPGAGRDEYFNIRQSLFGFYVQDDFRWRPNLTVNMGLRYEFITVPTETNGKVANLRDVMDTRTTIGDPMFKNPSLKNFGPRFGFAWDPRGTGKMSFRGGVGVFFSPIDTSYLHDTVFRVPPFFVRPEVTPATFPDQFDRTVAGRDLETLDIYELGEVFGFNFLQYDMKNPYMVNFHASVQRELLANTVLTAAYVGSRGHNLARVVDVNTPVPTQREDGTWVYPATAPRLNPTWGSIHQKIFDANSFYNSLQLSLRRRFTRGLLYQAAYTLSRSTDDASGSTQGGDGFATSNTNVFLVDDRLYDRGYSDFDRRHVFASSVVWELPVGPGQRFGSGISGVAEKVLGGWQVSGTVSLRSGEHTSVFIGPDRARTLHGGIGYAQRPDLVPGANANPINPGNPEQYISRESFAVPERFTLGSLPRNTVTLPGVATVDMSLTKMTRIGGGVQIQFRADIFNVLNRANFGTPNLTVFGGTATNLTPQPTFGRITSTRTEARQAQLGVKIIF